MLQPPDEGTSRSDPYRIGSYVSGHRTEPTDRPAEFASDSGLPSTVASESWIGHVPHTAPAAATSRTAQAADHEQPSHVMMRELRVYQGVGRSGGRGGHSGGPRGRVHPVGHAEYFPQ